MSQHEKYLDIAFKGDRTYLQGGDIVDALHKVIGLSRPFRFRMHRLVGHPLKVTPQRHIEADHRSADGHLVLVGKASPEEYALLEDTSRVVLAREPYDEQRVIAGARFDAQAASMPRNSEYTFMEQLVALNKAFLQRIIPDRSIKWYFTQLDLDLLPESFDLLTLVQSHRLGIRLVKSLVDVDRRRLGMIAYSGVRQ